MTTISRKEQVRGGLVGLHTGDAIFAPYETWRRKDIANDMKKRGGLTFFDYTDPFVKNGTAEMLPAGRPTDDSDQAADLAYSLILNNGLDTEHLYHALRRSVVEGKSRLWNGRAFGSGRTTRNALNAKPRTKRVSDVPINSIGTNGSLMRSTPLALWIHPMLYGRDAVDYRPMYTKEAKEMVTAMSSVTHDHQHSIDACWIFCLVLGAVMEQVPEADLLDWILDIDPELTTSHLFNRTYQAYHDVHLHPIDPGDWPMRGTAELTLYVALHTLKHATTFAEGISMAGGIGGDTDTYAATAGGLLGAKFGYSAIPKEWRDTILGHNQMIEYADAIYERM